MLLLFHRCRCNIYWWPVSNRLFQFFFLLSHTHTSKIEKKIWLRFFFSFFFSSSSFVFHTFFFHIYVTRLLWPIVFQFIHRLYFLVLSVIILRVLLYISILFHLSNSVKLHDKKKRAKDRDRAIAMFSIRIVIKNNNKTIN